MLALNATIEPSAPTSSAAGSGFWRTRSAAVAAVALDHRGLQGAQLGGRRALEEKLPAAHSAQHAAVERGRNHGIVQSVAELLDTFGLVSGTPERIGEPDGRSRTIGEGQPDRMCSSVPAPHSWHGPVPP
jgi:hypothetical protein